MARPLLLALALVVALAATATRAAYCHGSPSPGAQPNMLPIEMDDPVLVNSTANGKLYQVGSNEDLFHILHLFGTPYEMGFAHGTLLKAQLQVFIPSLYTYIDTMAKIPDLPTWLSNILVTEGAEAALLATALITKRYTPDYWFQELQGLADGSGLPYNKLLEMHMIGELTKGSCSMFGAWGSAIPAGDSLLQLRALDWDTTGPYRNYPLISVYHPQTGNGHAFATIGFMGWIGGLSGMSSVPMGVSEIGVSFPDASFGEESRFGYPFTFLIRDILQFDADLDATITRLDDAARTCDLILGAGDGNMKTFRSFEYSFSTLKVIDDVDFLPVNDTWHQPIENVVYHGMDWLCPAYNLALYTQLSKLHGNITAENTIRYITPIVETGSLHIGVYDFTRALMYVSFAASEDESGPLDAWARTFTQLNMTTLFSEQPPSSL